MSDKRTHSFPAKEQQLLQEIKDLKQSQGEQDSYLVDQDFRISIIEMGL
ncbi:hypothetical protein [Geomicrobium sp. JCM 19037]|nr:hypothetical protein [Geomicrobium sp. JCM 19037]